MPLLNMGTPISNPNPDCPLCDCADTEILKRKEETIVYYCRDCGHSWEEYYEME